MMKEWYQGSVQTSNLSHRSRLEAQLPRPSRAHRSCRDGSKTTRSMSLAHTESQIMSREGSKTTSLAHTVSHRSCLERAQRQLAWLTL